MSLRARLLSVVVALSLFASASGFARVLWVCRMSGRVAASCCCAQGKKSHSSSDSLRAPDCCEASVIKTHDRLASDREDAPKLREASLSLVLPEPTVPARVSFVTEDEPARARGPPGAGPPIFILHCSLLV